MSDYNNGTYDFIFMTSWAFFEVRNVAKVVTLWIFCVESQIAQACRRARRRYQAESLREKKKFVRIAKSWITWRSARIRTLATPVHSAARKVFRCNNSADSDLST